MNEITDGEGSRRSGTSTPVHAEQGRAPLIPQAGAVPVPSKENAPPTPTGHGERSLGHDVNTAHVKDGKDVPRQASPGMGTQGATQDNQPPNWQAQGAILDKAAHGEAEGGTVKRDVDKLRQEQQVHAESGEMKGPTGLPISGRAAVDGAEHDRKQQALLAGQVSKDGEGSAGLPYDAGN